MACKKENPYKYTHKPANIHTDVQYTYQSLNYLIIIITWLTDWMNEWLACVCLCMCMNGWIDGWMDGWLGNWLVGWMVRCLTGSLDEWLAEWLNLTVALSLTHGILFYFLLRIFFFCLSTQFSFFFFLCPVNPVTTLNCYKCLPT